MSKNKPHNATDVIQEIDDMIDHLPGKEHYYINIDDMDPPLRIEIHKGMTYAELRKAYQKAYNERELKNARKILLPKVIKHNGGGYDKRGTSILREEQDPGDTE